MDKLTRRVCAVLALCVMLAAVPALRAAAVTKTKPEAPETSDPATTEAPLTVPFAMVIDENGEPVTDAQGITVTAADVIPETDENGEPVTVLVDVTLADGETTQVGVPVTVSREETGLTQPAEPTEQTEEPVTKLSENPMVRGAFAGGAVVVLAMLAFLVLRILKKKPAQAEAVQAGALRAEEHSGEPRLRIGNLANIGRRDSQQDSFGISDIADETLVAAKGVLAVVADGIGGLQGGAEISSVVTSHFMGSFAALPAQLTPPEQLLRLTQEANRKSLGHIRGGMSGSTLVAAILKDGQLWFVSVGDSRICLLREGALVQLNREHTMASQLDEDAARGRITVEEARGDRQRGALTSFIGMGELKQIDRNLKPIALQPGDQVLLMTDGVFGTLSDEEMLAILTANAPYAAAAAMEKAVLAKQKPGQDNFTAIILGM